MDAPRATEATLKSLLQVSARDAAAMAAMIGRAKRSCSEGDLDDAFDLAEETLAGYGIIDEDRLRFVDLGLGQRTLICDLDTKEFYIGHVPVKKR